MPFYMVVHCYIPKYITMESIKPVQFRIHFAKAQAFITYSVAVN